MMTPRDAFSGSDGPVHIKGDAEEPLSELLEDEISPPAADEVEPELDE